jgi:nucleoid-associated protein YgaU
MRTSENFRAGAALLGSAAVLVGCSSEPRRLCHGLRAPHAWVAAAGSDAAVEALAGTMLWLVALWTTLALSATALSLLPGRVGRLARSVARRITPAVLRRLVVATAGTSILISPVAASAGPIAGGTATPSARAATPAAGAAAHTLAVTPRLPMDRTGSSASNRPAAPPHSMPPSPSMPPLRRAGTLAPAVAPPAGSDARVTVRAGDSLWSIAARRLGRSPSAARIQAEWPRWYAANRGSIGADPDLIRPGASLLVPPPASAGTGIGS